MTGPSVPPPERRRSIRAVVSAALGAALTTVLLVLAVAPAQAAGYRYWSFWIREDGSWSYANQGPAVLRPADGDVLGFRFAVSENSKDAARPRGTADFTAICGDTAPEDGRKRIALSLDFGTARDAPDGERPPEPRTACARVAEDATAADALAATAEPLRYNSSALLCAIAGYPEQGCGEQVSADDTAGDGSRPSADGAAGGDGKDGGGAGADEGGGDGGSTVGVIAGIGVVLALALAAFGRSRRRRG